MRELHLSPERIVLCILLAPLYGLYGLFALLRGVFRLWKRAHGMRFALARELRCPNGHINNAVGRFECAACRATYHGWVGRCEVCGAGAAWFPCDVCGVSIQLPWVRR